MPNAELQRARNWPDVIILNGPSSAGKSTLSVALRDAVSHPYLHVGFDDFVFMASPRYYRGADSDAQGTTDRFTNLGVEMVHMSGPGEPPAVVARFGPVFRAILDGMAPAVRALVDHGSSVIFDHVLHDEEMVTSVEEAFDGIEVFAVGVTCPIDILEARERVRGDRVIGRARGLDGVVHTFLDYDVTVDTGSAGPGECVARIVEAIRAREPGAGGRRR
jgi:chloramphenicol 3-O phosphotransferase